MACSGGAVISSLHQTDVSLEELELEGTFLRIGDN